MIAKLTVIMKIISHLLVYLAQRKPRHVPCARRLITREIERRSAILGNYRKKMCYSPKIKLQTSCNKLISIISKANYKSYIIFLGRG